MNNDVLFCPECEEEVEPILVRSSNEEWGIEVICECPECCYEFVNGI